MCRTKLYNVVEHLWTAFQDAFEGGDMASMNICTSLAFIASVFVCAGLLMS